MQKQFDRIIITDDQGNKQELQGQSITLFLGGKELLLEKFDHPMNAGQDALTLTCSLKDGEHTGTGQFIIQPGAANLISIQIRDNQ